jgi:serine/threonine-protein kinase
MSAGSSTTELTARDNQAAAEEQLNRILASRAFRQADRLKHFLTVVVRETIAGRGERLKEFVVGVEVFGKPDSFDPRTDPIVRVQARRLRTQLARYYREEGQNDPTAIELPKGGYAPIFRPLRNAPAQRPLKPALLPHNTVLVSTFADHSAAGDQKHFCAGLREELIHTLAGQHNIRLIASDSVDAREGKASAAMIVTGAVRTDGAQARITANLIDTATGSFLWSTSLDRKLENIFAVQEEVARLIADQLITDREGRRSSIAAGRRTDNLAAYNLYLQGRYHLNQRTEEGLRRAVDFFDRAIAEDAQYAQAYSGLSDAYGLLGHYGVLAPAEVWTKTASNAAWAVLQDEYSVEAHTSLAHVKATQDWDWLGAEAEFQRAIALDPRYPTAHHWYAVSCLAPMGRLDAALEEMRLAEATDPISSIIARDVARVQYYQRNYENALDQCDHAIELNPHFSVAYVTLGMVQEQRGDFDEAAAAFQRALQLSPHSPITQAALARTLALSGKKGDAVRVVRDLHTLAEHRYVSPFELALVHFALAESDEGFGCLAKAFQDRCFELILLRVDPRWQSLRGTARFEQLLSQLNLP